MQTSYYSKYKNNNAISIAGKCPDWFDGKGTREYKKLAPKYWFFAKYKDKNDEHYMDEKFYIENYKKEVLDKLNAKQVLKELCEILKIEITDNPNIVLLCWESSEKFCHRHLVAKWFKEQLNIDVVEF
jgi:uncharacterized protein (DUF488 family)